MSAPGFTHDKIPAKLLSVMQEFQKRVDVVPKSSFNPFYSSKYADLPTIMEAIKPLLDELGLVITFGFGNFDKEDVRLWSMLPNDTYVIEWLKSTKGKEHPYAVRIPGVVEITATFSVTEGDKSHSYTETMPVPLPIGATVQQVGAAMTYCRRYLLSAFLNIVTDNDDDGNSATTAVDIGALERLAKKKGVSLQKVALDVCQVRSSRDLTVQVAEKLTEYLNGLPNI